MPPSKDLAQIPATDRVLLLSHCLRPSQTCPGRFSKQGLVCPESCDEDCALGRLAAVALSLGYKGVCIAPGGRMAINFVRDTHPLAIVAVACEQELEEGIQAVDELAAKAHATAPIIATVPLSRDGCVDTAVDEGRVRETLVVGCNGAESEGDDGNGAH